MSEPYLGEIMVFAGSFAPVSYALCQGQLIPISQNGSLYALISNFYGGDPNNDTMGLPDLRGRVALCQGQSPASGSNYTMGQMAGSETITLSAGQMPAHTHPLFVTNNAKNATGTPTQNSLISDEVADLQEGTCFVYGPYNPGARVNLAPASVSNSSGTSTPHSNMQPYVVVSYCIALQGIYPSQ